MKWNFTQVRVGSSCAVFFCSVLCATTLAFAASNPTHDHQLIVDTATSFAYAAHAGKHKVDIQINLPDSRLNLPACEAGLVAFWPPGAAKVGHSTVAVQCQGANQWKIHLRAQIKIYDYVAVLRAVAAKDDVVTEDNVDLELTDLASIRGETIRDIEPVLGFRFKRRVAAGRALTMKMLGMPRLIRKGENVEIIASAGLLNVRMKGVALEDGEQGGMVRVRNSSSDRIIQGRVVSRGKVSVSY